MAQRMCSGESDGARIAQHLQCFGAAELGVRLQNQLYLVVVQTSTLHEAF